MLDKSTKVQPADLVILTSKMEKEHLVKRIQYILLGDMKQLESYNTIRVLAPVNTSPNKMLLEMNLVPSRLSNVYRTYGEIYIQTQLPDSIFPGNGHKAFHFISNNHSSHPVAQSRANPKEAADVVNYVNELLRCAIQPSSIAVITLNTAQKDLLQNAKAENATWLFSHAVQPLCKPKLIRKKFNNNESSIADESRIQLKNRVTSHVYLISDPSIILVSLFLSRYFTTVSGTFPPFLFGNSSSNCAISNSFH
uniref:AAA_12 domain-containing protein n=1 Tax=Caenorhabditis tropicalis TaxID=1561998 RepID=A0A1I7U2V1_9PELO